MNVFTIQILRYTLGLCWIYQGVFPKLVSIAPLEKKLTATMGFSLEVSDMITRVAGVSEIVFGVLLIIFYRYRTIHILNIAALCGLLAYVVLMLPVLLLEAFNPVTTNIPMMLISFVLLEQCYSSEFRK